MTQSPTLPSADFFLLRDMRGEDQVLDHQFDEGEPWTGAASEETERICEGRRQLMHRLSPTMLEDELWVSLQFSVPPELVHSKSYYNSRKPARLYHHEHVTSFLPICNYDVVSLEWRKAIEKLEGGVHEFFHHELIFRDGSASDRFVFRNRIVIENCLHPNEEPLGSCRSSSGLYWLDDRSNRINARVNTARIGSHHWVRCPRRGLPPGLGFVVVSRPLAIELTPLLPESVCFWPLQ